MMLGDDIRNIFVFINGKIVTFLVKKFANYIRISAITHPPQHPTSYPRQTTTPSFIWKRKSLLFSDSCLSLSYSLFISICDRYITLQHLRLFNEFGTGI